MAKIKGVYECMQCHGLCPIVKRYRNHEYRYCKNCNTKYLTHVIDGEIKVIRTWTPVTRNVFADEF